MPAAAASVVTRTGPSRLSVSSTIEVVKFSAARSDMCRTTRIAACSSPSAMSSRLATRDDFSIHHVYHIYIGNRYKYGERTLLPRVHAYAGGTAWLAQTRIGRLDPVGSARGLAPVSTDCGLPLCCNRSFNTLPSRESLSGGDDRHASTPRHHPNFGARLVTALGLNSILNYICKRCNRLKQGDG